MHAHPIYPMALATTLLAFAVGGSLMWQFSPKSGRRSLLPLMLLSLPLSPLAFFCVRTPLLLQGLDPPLVNPLPPAIRDTIRLLYAPLTEEPAKLLPLAVLWAMGWWPVISKKRIASIALALGLGFAVGECWLVAYMVAAKNDPKLAALPWYAFGGFLNERLICVLTHALFVMPTLWLSRRGWKLAPLGLFLGMTLHYLGNAPIILMHHNAIALGQPTWQVLVQLWLILLAILALVLMILMRYGTEMLKRVWKAEVICPECGMKYKQPLLMALNMGTWRYEQCGACKRWHWISLENLAK